MTLLNTAPTVSKITNSLKKRFQVDWMVNKLCFRSPTQNSLESQVEAVAVAVLVDLTADQTAVKSVK